MLRLAVRESTFYWDFESARELVRRIAFRYKLQHGSWLNVAGSEPSAPTRPSIPRRRIGKLEELRRETGASTHRGRSPTPAGTSCQSILKSPRD